MKQPQSNDPIKHHTTIAASFILVLCSLTACRSNPEFAPGEIEGLKVANNSDQNVLLVRITDDHLARMPHGYHKLTRTGIVVRSLKGTWKVGERISYYKNLESFRPNYVPQVGQEEYLFTNEHASTPVYIDTGESYGYSPQTERRLNFVLSIKHCCPTPR